MENKIYTANELQQMQEATKAKTSQRDTLLGKKAGLIDAVKKNFNVATGEELLAKKELEVKNLETKEAEYAKLCTAHRSIKGVE